MTGVRTAVIGRLRSCVTGTLKQTLPSRRGNVFTYTNDVSYFLQVGRDFVCLLHDIDDIKKNLSGIAVNRTLLNRGQLGAVLGVSECSFHDMANCP
ncbi:hypothetical protein D3C72_1976490 [compost metagenome]